MSHLALGSLRGLTLAVGLVTTIVSLALGLSTGEAVVGVCSLWEETVSLIPLTGYTRWGFLPCRHSWC